MNRRGVVGDTVTGWVLKFSLIIICVIAVISIVNMGIKEDIETFEVESTVFYHKVISMDGGLSYVDGDTGRVTLGVIDFDRMNNTPDLLDNIFGDSSHIVANFTLVGPTLRSDIYYHKTDFKTLLVYYKANAKSKVQGTVIGIPVTIRSDELEKQEQGVLTATIISPGK